MLDSIKRLFAKNFELTENILILRERIDIGRKLQTALNGEDFKMLNEHILLPLQIGAFEAFKKIPADAPVLILEAQLMSKMIDTIRREVEIKINQGRLAEEQLKALPEMGEQEA
ncbi:MAG: hypothetical protein QME51_08065 [Planctomycetota bacterium]|nr:hypothetical protein [Planctomycetota bacterium]